MTTNSREKWIQWIPIEGLGQKYLITNVVHDLKNFRILLTDAENERKKIRIVFEQSVDVFRRTTRQERLRTLAWLEKQHGRVFYESSTFFKVQHSAYVAWVEEGKAGFFGPQNLEHFVFLDDNNMIEVVDNGEPRVEFVREEVCK